MQLLTSLESAITLVLDKFPNQLGAFNQFSYKSVIRLNY